MLEQLHIFLMIYETKLKNIYPDEKSENRIGRSIVPYRKVFDGIMFILRTGCHGKSYPKRMVLVPHATEDFRTREDQIDLVNY